MRAAGKLAEARNLCHRKGYIMIHATTGGGLLVAVLLDKEPVDDSYSPPRSIRRMQYADVLAEAVGTDDIGETLPPMPAFSPFWQVAA